MTRFAAFLILCLSFALTAGCDNRTSPAASTTLPPTAASSTALPTQQLRMNIDGQAWAADNDLFGAVNPPGHDRAVLIGGSHGKGKDDQDFTLNLYGVEGTGPRIVKSGTADLSVAQISNLSSSRYLAGGILGYALQVDLIRYSATPLLIEARFAGTLTANDDKAVAISDGYFFYAE